MPTDDERRRIAAALREYASFDHECEDEEEFSVDCADWGERVINLLDCGDTEEECYAYLADLIDPTCLARADVEDTPDGGQFECWSCSVCGNIVSADPDYDTETDGPAYCEACGHRIVGKGEPTWL